MKIKIRSGPFALMLTLNVALALRVPCSPLHCVWRGSEAWSKPIVRLGEAVRPETEG